MIEFEREDVYIVEGTCPFCGEESVALCEEYDSEFCVECDRWLETACTDPFCRFCAKRPARPTDIEYIRTYKK